MTNNIKLDLRSMDIAEEQKARLKQLFPEVFNEDKIDFDKLRLALGEDVDTGRERFGMNWPGKTQAIRVAQEPSIATLKPDRDASVDFDTTENLFVEGDNLEVLKLLQKSCFGKINMIYIDPPYNTGNEFIYPDKYAEGLDTYLQYTGQIDAEGKKFTTNTETDGRYHSKWMNMMWPRLFLARNLLTEDGVIFISIDDHEFDNLKKICNEIFGEENFRNCLITRRRVKSLNLQFAENGLNTLNVGFEYILVYAKSDAFLFKPLRMQKENVSTKGVWNVFWSGADRKTMRYELLGFTPTTGQWRWSKEKAEVAINNYNEYLNKYSNKVSLEDYWQNTGELLRFIRRIPNGEGKNGGVQYWIPPSDTSLRTSDWTDIEVSQIHKEFDIPFDNPKSTKLIRTIIDSYNGNDFTILDFFAGSGTTAHAVMGLNAEDGGCRKFIMSQLPEVIGENSKAFEFGYKNIAEIGEERIRLAGKKILEENIGREGFDADKFDKGFKVFKLDKSNFIVWDGKDTTELQPKLQLSVKNINSESNHDDLLTELLLKSGFELTSKIEIKTINDNKVYLIADGSLVICLENEIDKDLAKAIAELKPVKVICLNSGFKSDADLTNTAQIMKAKEIEFRTV